MLNINYYVINKNFGRGTRIRTLTKRVGAAYASRYTIPLFLFIASNPRLFSTIRAFSLSAISHSLNAEHMKRCLPHPIKIITFPFMSALRTF